MTLSRSKRLIIINVFLIIILYSIVERRARYVDKLSSYKTTVHAQNYFFRQKLVRQLLASHSNFYGAKLNNCNIVDPFTHERSRVLVNISQLLIKLREQIVAYPEENFQGQGIVLTVGMAQVSFEKINLKMIELSGTRLPVQVKHV